MRTGALGRMIDRLRTVNGASAALGGRPWSTKSLMAGSTRSGPGSGSISKLSPLQFPGREGVLKAAREPSAQGLPHRLRRCAG